jgi:hypothetical protein
MRWHEAFGDPLSFPGNALHRALVSVQTSLGVPLSAQPSTVIANPLPPPATERECSSNSLAPVPSPGAGSARVASPGGANRAAAAGMDPQQWTLNFADLQMQRQIGEGSFGRVSACRTGKGPGAWLACGLAYLHWVHGGVSYPWLGAMAGQRNPFGTVCPRAHAPFRAFEAT